MSILGAQPLPTLNATYFLPLVLLPLIVFGLRRAGVFRKGSIAGPVRVAPSESLFTLVAIVCFAYLVAFLALVAIRPFLNISPADLAAVTTPPSPVPAATTAPAAPTPAPVNQPTTTQSLITETTSAPTTAFTISTQPTTAPTTALANSAQPTTAPTTAPAAPSPETVRLLYGLNAAFSLLALAGLLVLSIALRPGAAQLLGLHPRLIPRGLLAALLTALLSVPLVNMVSALVLALMVLLRLQSPQAHEVLEELTRTRDPVAVATMIVLAVVLAPVLEELTFRGYLQTLLAHAFARLEARRAARNLPDPPNPPGPDLPLASVNPASPSPTARWTAVCATAVLFALVHREPAFMPPLFVLAVALGYVYERTGNLYAPILTHALFNGFQILAFLTLSQK